ncbi:MAG: hypothetical protein HZT40_02780 [Candidatus Thiothrix singaporensis]|uniref:PD-(D/E)XK endonuclease-like domain-containing protein n=1 Tax=Candidatus Thiothrix singaporensis TaxID=2799669 RepID=A0A7L6ANN7_9GAMM|nr:MAG: hypothetical protein HZT40_02780 [Candidatus Thiothrix singaporensis]
MTSRLQTLWDASVRLEQLAGQESMPAAQRMPLCQTCSQAAFCGFD